MRHTLKYICQATGLTAHVIRVWEKRYHVVTPMRCLKNRRFYTNEDLERLLALAVLTKAGYRISELAVLTTAVLHNMVHQAREAALACAAGRSQCTAALPSEDASHVQHCLTAVENLDAAHFRDLLQQSLNQRGCQGTMKRLLIPLLCEIGERWKAGEMRIVHEHFATVETKNFLGGCLTNYGMQGQGAGELVFTTPHGQMHEMGAFLAATLARSAGWNATYLGPSLPAEEIASAARLRGASGVVMSLVFPEGDAVTTEELRRLRQLLPGLPLLIGGRAVPSYLPVLNEIQACLMAGYEDFDTWLKEKKPALVLSA